MNKTNSTTNFSSKFILSVIILVIMFILSLLLGAEKVALNDVWLSFSSNIKNTNINIIREIRLPREIAAVFVGAALAVSGAIMQGISKNSLADPGILGLTAGANAALTVTIALIPSANYLTILISCFLGSALAVLLVFGISISKSGRFSPFRIVLAGSAISTFLFAISQGIQIYFKLSKDVSMWTSGGLIGTSWDELTVIVPFISVGIATALVLSRQLTILSLSEEVAIGLGQKTAIIKSILFVVVTILAGAAVALASNLVFLGLIVPHITYFIIGKDYKFVIPISAVLGAALMVFADILGRLIAAPYETPVAAIISIIGLPFFLFIVHKGGNKN
ncbi:FecCD family ABC transporter permease [Clostridium felsineum]|uniref:FecCD family ABC transporter permease n=1 Tax=Clostridium felsineum TaxID=36839 RepID=UPI00098CCFF5|nr:iron ABC transporter permease [Clostridium felsineum]URZ01568.1 Iron-uptake system permease protein FeuB [Clostridium felsineum]